LSVKPKPSVLVFVADVRQVSTFYGELASMSVLLEADDHAVMEVEGLQLVIHGLRAETQVRQSATGQVPVRQDSYVKLCLPVSSIAAARSLAAANGGAVKPSQHEWEARGFRACDGHDPEGNVIQVREPAI